MKLPPFPVRGFLTLSLFLAGVAAFSVETPTTLISYTPDVYAVKRNIEADEAVEYLEAFYQAANEEVIFSPPPPEELEARAGDLELIVFTADKPGKCSACDRARPIVLGLSKLYPVTIVPCSLSSKPRCKGDYIAREYNVREFPTFVLVERLRDGDAALIARWSGCGSFFDPLDKRIEREFKRAGLDKPRKPPIPPRGPRPIPGLRREPPKPPKHGGDVPSGRRPGAPRIGFTIDLSELPEFAE